MTVYAMLGGDPESVTGEIAVASAVAKRLSTSLTGLIVMPDPASAAVYVAGPDMVMTGSAGISAIQKAQEVTVETLSAAFADATKAHADGVATTLVSEEGEPALRAAGAATLSKALVLPHGAANTSHALNPAFEHVLMTAELPLVMASSTPGKDEACMIAWDGSPQAARAVRMHLDLIKTYSKIVIAHNPEKVRPVAQAAGSADVDKFADYLRSEGLSPSTHMLAGDLSDSLLQAASDHHVGLLVMGAYGHSRLGEMLFGGTSRAMLNAKDRPSLALAH